MSSQIAPSDHDLDDEFLDWTVRARALARSTGAPVLACLAGLQQVPTTPGTFGLGFAARPGRQQAGLVELAMLADLALGGALRQRLGRTRPLPTLSLTLELAAPLESENSSLTAVVGQTSSASGGIGTAAGSLAGPCAVTGHCAATFAAPSRGEQNELPWDRPKDVLADAAASCGPDHATAEDRALAVAARLAEARGQSWGDHLLEQATTTTDEGAVFSPNAAMTNRGGMVQGGVLFALAVRCGTPKGGESEPWPASATMRFLSGADTSEPITALAEIQHATRRTVFAEVRLIQEREIRAVAGLVYRR